MPESRSRSRSTWLRRKRSYSLPVLEIGCKDIEGGHDTLDRRGAIAAANSAFNAGFGQEELEVEVFGEALDEAVSLGQARAAAKDRAQIALPDAVHDVGQPHGMPVLLHERRIDAEFGRDRLKQLLIRRRAQGSRRISPPRTSLHGRGGSVRAHVATARHPQPVGSSSGCPVDVFGYASACEGLVALRCGVHGAGAGARGRGPLRSSGVGKMAELSLGRAGAIASI